MIDSKKLIAMVEKYEKLIYDTADYIWAHPETGFREWNTSAYMEKHFKELGYTLTKAGNIPGFYADLDTGKPGPKIAIPETAKVESYVRGASFDAITMDQDAVVYNDDGTITLKFTK